MTAHALGPEIICDHAGAGDAVHIIVPVNGHRLARFDRLPEPVDRLLHVLQCKRIAQQRLVGVQKLLRLLRGVQPALPEHGGQQRGKARAEQGAGDLRRLKGDIPL